MMTMQDRCAEANKVIEIIANHGRRFFFSEAYDRISRFDVDRHGSIWYVDHHTGMQFAPLKSVRWAGFTNGATARELIQYLADYIETGDKVPFSQFEKEWGYGAEEMSAVRFEVVQTDAVKGE